MDSSELEFENTDVSEIVANDAYKIHVWLNSKYVHVVVTILYLFIFLFGLTGNLLVVYSVFKHKSKQTVTNVFIVNLAVANILLGLFHISIIPVLMILREWVFGFFMCYLVAIIYSTACHVSTLILPSIALHRYLSMVHQFRFKMKKRYLLIIIVIMWLASIMASLPMAINHTYKEYSYSATTCIESWPSPEAHHIYYVTRFVKVIVIALVVTASFYIALTIKMSRMSTRMADERGTNRLLIAMAAVSFICFVPINILGLILLNDHLTIDIIVAFTVVNVLESSSTCFTPLFYMWLNKITIKQFGPIGLCSNGQSLNGSTGVYTQASNYTALSIIETQQMTSPTVLTIT